MMTFHQHTEFCERSGYGKASDWKPANGMRRQFRIMSLAVALVELAAGLALPARGAAQYNYVLSVDLNADAYVGNPDQPVQQIGSGNPVELGCAIGLTAVTQMNAPAPNDQIQHLGDLMSIKVPWKVGLILDGKMLATKDGPPSIPGGAKYVGCRTYNCWTWTGSAIVEEFWIAEPPTSSQDAGHELRCQVDIGHDIKESNEQNNSGTTKFSVLVPLHRDPNQPVALIPGGNILPAPPLAPSDRQTPEAPRRINRPPSGGRYLQPAPSLAPTRTLTPTQVFSAPMWSGKRVDLCLVWGGQCGEPAATEFCKRSGYTKASAWQPANDIGAQTPTLVLSSGQVCSDSSCDSFASITCTQ